MALLGFNVRRLEVIAVTEFTVLAWRELRRKQERHERDEVKGARKWGKKEFLTEFKLNVTTRQDKAQAQDLCFGTYMY
jgi:hypothetical protein